MADEVKNEEKAEEKKETSKEEVHEETTSKEEPKESAKENKKEKKDRFQRELDSKNDEIARLKNQVDDFKDKYYRSIASLDNQRKQYEKEYQQLAKYSSQNLAEKLIPSFEMFSMVIESANNLPPEVSAYVQGFDMIYRQMLQALESEGITEITVKVGDEFDHNLHSAMETVEVTDEKLNNKISKVVRKGYKIHDRLLKPATVVVSKYKAEETKKDEVKEEKKDETKANA